MAEIGWEILVIASSLQKVLPVFLLNLFSVPLRGPILVLRVLVRVVNRVNLLHIKKLLGYSSVFTTAWLISCETSFKTVVEYLSGYLLALSGVALVIRLETSIQLNDFLADAHFGKVAIVIGCFLSIAGRPPFVGFYVKVAVLQELIYAGQVLWSVVLVRGSIFLLYVYMRFIFKLVRLGGGVGLIKAEARSWHVARVRVFFVLLLFP